MPTRTSSVALLLSTLLLLSQPVMALKAQHEADRLLLAAQKALDTNNYTAANQHLNAAQKLKTKLPANFYFMKGKLLLHESKNASAQDAFETYVDKVGRKGKHYEEALGYITRIQKAGRPRQNTKPVAELKWSKPQKKDQAYVDKLQMLYMSESPTRALTTHINTLLKFYAFNDNRVKAASRLGKTTRHQIRSSKKGEIIATHLPTAKDNATDIAEERFSVYGVNPYVDYRCSENAKSCWLLHPVNQRQWLQIVRNEEAASELSKALAYLIKELQKG